MKHRVYTVAEYLKIVTYLEVLGDLWSNLRLKLNPTEVVRRHLEDIIKLTDMLINRYFNAHFFLYLLL